LWKALPLWQGVQESLAGELGEERIKKLHRLYTESEAMVGSKFPMVPMKLDKIAGITGLAEEELLHILENMAPKGLVFWSWK